MSRIPREQAITFLVRDIHEQSTRHRRATTVKRYLTTDLEIIENKVEALRTILASDEPEVLYPPRIPDKRKPVRL
jgi:hypothetical protein